VICNFSCRAQVDTTGGHPGWPYSTPIVGTPDEVLFTAGGQHEGPGKGSRASARARSACTPGATPHGLASPVAVSSGVGRRRVLYELRPFSMVDTFRPLEDTAKGAGRRRESEEHGATRWTLVGPRPTPSPWDGRRRRAHSGPTFASDVYGGTAGVECGASRGHPPAGPRARPAARHSPDAAADFLLNAAPGALAFFHAIRRSPAQQFARPNRAHRRGWRRRPLPRTRKVVAGPRPAVPPRSRTGGPAAPPPVVPTGPAGIGCPGLRQASPGNVHLAGRPLRVFNPAPKKVFGRARGRPNDRPGLGGHLAWRGPCPGPERCLGGGCD